MSSTQLQRSSLRRGPVQVLLDVNHVGSTVVVQDGDLLEVDGEVLTTSMGSTLGQPWRERMSSTKVTLDLREHRDIRDWHGRSIQNDTGAERVLRIEAVADGLILGVEAIGKCRLGHGDGDLRVGLDVDVGRIWRGEVEVWQTGAIGQGASVHDGSDVAPLGSPEADGSGGDGCPQGLRHNPTRTLHLLLAVGHLHLLRACSIRIALDVRSRKIALLNPLERMMLGLGASEVFGIDDAAAAEARDHPNVGGLQFVDDKLMIIRPLGHAGMLVDERVPSF
mmetsp:Transcript_601/g.1703  ORF Transcript_601/g.1703 Transcript_601/m.1703 type:complete len:279 (-) Transcript_601:573-1409(-)